jgi:predicted dinucleotide-binding enzyme
MKVAIVGGTGPFGRGLAGRLAEAGDDVTIGSRDAERARATADELGVRGQRNEDAVEGAELVVLAVEASAALATAQALRIVIATTPVLSVASVLEFEAATVDAPMAAGLHSLAAGKLAHGRPAEDALVCGHDGEAKARALELAGKVVDGRAIDAGPLAVARALEGMTAAIVNVNRRYKAHAGIQLTGLE